MHRLSADDFETLLKPAWIRALWRSFDSEHLPANWLEWLQHIARPDFTAALEIAERGLEEWPSAKALGTAPEAVQQFAEALIAVPDGVPQQRLALALPLLVEWVQTDPRYPNPLLVPVYDSLLTILALNPARSEVELQATYLLLDALLACGLNPNSYRDLLDTALELARSGGSVRTLDWLLDTVELSVIHPCAGAAVRENFWAAVLAVLQPLMPQLQAGQKYLLRNLAQVLGWQDFAAEPALQAETQEKPFAKLAGLSVAIYTLTEKAGKHAAELLKQLVPNIRVELNHDHVGTDKLKALAENADIFVVATQSAKHAATGFINLHRPKDKPVLFPAGKGASSIVRVVGEFVG